MWTLKPRTMGRLLRHAVPVQMGLASADALAGARKKNCVLPSTVTLTGTPSSLSTIRLELDVNTCRTWPSGLQPHGIERAANRQMRTATSFLPSTWKRAAMRRNLPVRSLATELGEVPDPGVCVSIHIVEESPVRVIGEKR